MAKVSRVNGCHQAIACTIILDIGCEEQKRPLGLLGNLFALVNQKWMPSRKEDFLTSRPPGRSHSFGARSIVCTFALTFLLVARRIFAPRNGDFRYGEAAMTNDKRRSSDERRSRKDRRSGIDTRSDEERRLIGERRSNNERRSGLDRRSSNTASLSPVTGGRDT
jgi:hypothetical protein